MGPAQLIGMAFAMLFAAGFGFAAWRLGSWIVLGRRSKRWPTVYGTIHHAALVGHRAGGYRGVAMVYHTAVKYSYVYRDITHESERLRIDEVRLPRRWAESILQRYRPGQTVEVAVDPMKPTRAVLIRGNHPLIVIAFVFAAIVSCMALLAVIAFVV